jgi:transposase
MNGERRTRRQGMAGHGMPRWMWRRRSWRTSSSTNSTRCWPCGYGQPGERLAGAGSASVAAAGTTPVKERRRWRALDLGTVQVVLEADAPRVFCREHGVVVAQVPWARHSAGHTFAFNETVAWPTTQTSKNVRHGIDAHRVADWWRTVGSIIARVWADTEKLHDRFAGLRRLGIDEVSYKRGHRYLTVVIDHDSGR